MPMQAGIPATGVWCVDVYGLWQDLVDTSKVKATIESVTVPNYAE